MSQLARQTDGGRLFPSLPDQESPSSWNASAQKQHQQQILPRLQTNDPAESPTMRRGSGGSGGTSSTCSSATTPITNKNPFSASPILRSQRTPNPSPLQTTTAAAADSEASTPPLFDSSPALGTLTAPVDQSPNSLPQTSTVRKRHYFQPSADTTLASERSPDSPLSPLSRAFPIPNDSRTVSTPIKPSTSPDASYIRPALAMAGPRIEAAKGAPRNSSIDSAISAISTSSHKHNNSTDSASGPPDIGNLIKAAGSAEAVIQYLLKEKTSQAQQNAQLWRLVDKQRAMILGLNKDLERALKDKEKYRKKLKEVLSAPQVPPLPSAAALERSSESTAPARAGPSQLPKIEVPPLSPTLDSDSQKHSPIDVALAPYPITPPADQPNGPASAVGEMLDPSHSMPKPEEHALDQYDHEAEEREAEQARKDAEDEEELPLQLSMPLPPTRSPPSEPPRMPPPRPPVPAATDDGLAQFPMPPAPPPRKPPPAPLKLQSSSPAAEGEADAESEDSDLDELLDVKKDADAERRGRRRTREEDEKDREIIALKEAEIRSLSKKSRQSSSSKSTPKETVDSEIPASPRSIPIAIQFDHPSMMSVLNGNQPRTTEVVAPQSLLTPGLPSSPRPYGLPVSPLQSPPLSPRHAAGFAAPLSPRPPRQPIPLPLSVSHHTPPTEISEPLKSPKPLNMVKKAMDALTASSPTKNSNVRDSPTGESMVYTGFVTEEYPDLLLPPNALLSIDVKVASSRMKPSRASLLSLTQLEEDPVFTLAVFSRGQGTELWRVEKDSLSLAKLDQRMKQCPAFTARTPDRSLFSGHAPAKLDARRMALDSYLDEMLNTPLDTATAVELCKYLSTNTLPANADETGSAMPRQDNNSFAKTGPGGRPFRNGYLTKRGKNFGGWKARFFVLEGPQLRYYETPGGAHLGTIKIQKAQIGKQSSPTANETSSPAGGSEEVDNQYRHAFLILEPKKKDPSAMTKHVLCAESDKERDLWVDALLRWIDFKDPEDEEKKAPSKKDTKPSHHTEPDQSSSQSSKKKKSSSRPPQLQAEGESLISVNYEATQQGEMPQTGRKANYDQPLPTPMGMSSQQAFATHDVGPRGPKGGNSGLLPPDEKKLKKRSFFGFSTKTRSSSDGNDSLFGGDSSSGPNNGQSGPYTGGSIRQVFGAPLAEAVRYNAPFDVRVPLPAVVYRCIQYLEANNALNEEGIFRLSGSNVVIKALRERFNTESDVNLVADEAYHDIHAVASLLKLYLRELPTTILTRDLHMKFVSVTEMPNSAAKIGALGELVERLPQANATLLKYLIAFLIKIINKSSINKMTVRNVGIVFSPTLNIPAPVFAMFLQNYEGIFGIDPEEYELPNPMAEQQQQQQQRQQHNDDASSEVSVPAMQRTVGQRRPSLASLEQARPMTSGQSGSPHRGRLAEAERQQQRSTPTPPPAAPGIGLGQLNNNHSRSMQQQQQAPPPQPQPVMYDPSYLAQQNKPGPMGGGRPAYDNFGVPPGYDLSQLHTPTGPRVVNPGYDRPVYDNGNNGYEAFNPGNGAGSSIKSRRESAMFMGGVMGGLNPQGSKSRLREESHY